MRAVLAGGAGCLLIFGGILGYRYFFTSGLEHLPERVCSGSVDREIVAKTLPAARDAQEGSRVNPPGGRFTFTCRVYTSGDSIMSGEAEPTDVSLTSWARHYEGQGSGKALKVKRGPVQVLSVSENRASVYVPCTPSEKKPGSASESYALITEARTIGSTRATGDELRQAVTDFAYALMKHAYEVSKCQETSPLPADFTDAY